jgi:hypothetical protein
MITIDHRTPRGKRAYWVVHCSECGDLRTEWVQRHLNSEAIAHNNFNHHNHFPVVVNLLNGKQRILNWGNTREWAKQIKRKKRGRD